MISINESVFESEIVSCGLKVWSMKRLRRCVSYTPYVKPAWKRNIYIKHEAYQAAHCCVWNLQCCQIRTTGENSEIVQDGVCDVGSSANLFHFGCTKCGL